MRSGAYFDIWTTLLYVSVGILGSIFIGNFKKSVVSIESHNVAVIRQTRERLYILLFFFLYVFLAVFRKVTYDIGGTDAQNYINNFNLILQHGGIDRTGNVELEPGFQFLTRLVRYITSEYKIYFLVCYGAITYGYIKFIRNVCPRGGIYLPFILLMYPYFRGFNTMRTSLAIAFILIGLTYLDRKKWKSLLFLIITVFIHRVSVLFVLVWPYYVLFSKPMAKLSRMKFAIVAIGGVFLTFMVAMSLRQYIMLFSLMDDTELSYMESVLDDNILMRWPLYLGPLMLFIVIFSLYNKIPWNRQTLFLRTLFVFDIWMIPAALVLGMWRFIEFFYLIRLSLWTLILPILVGRKSAYNKLIVKSSALVIFVAWLVIRVFKEWEATSVSPYILDLF